MDLGGKGYIRWRYLFFFKKIGKLGIIVEKVGSSKKLAKSDGMELETWKLLKLNTSLDFKNYTFWSKYQFTQLTLSAPTPQNSQTY